jgi:hypothetical protein
MAAHDGPRPVWVAVIRCCTTCRLQGGFASPRGSATGHLSGPYAFLAARGVHVHRHVSAAVVSTALAAGPLTDVPDLPLLGRESPSSPPHFPSLREDSPPERHGTWSASELRSPIGCFQDRFGVPREAFSLACSRRTEIRVPFNVLGCKHYEVIQSFLRLLSKRP